MAAERLGQKTTRALDDVQRAMIGRGEILDVIKCYLTA